MVPADDLARILATLRQLMPVWRHQRPATVEYLPGGYTNRNYKIEIDGGVFALRLTNRVANRHECRYLEIAPAPDVVAYDDRHGHLLTRWIDGAVLAEAPPTPAQGGALLANLQRQIPCGPRRYDFAAEVAAMLRQARLGGRLDARVVAVFERLNWRPTRWRGCHNDLNPWNVIRVDAGAGDKRFRVLDWESAGDNDPLFDVAGLCLGLQWNFAQSMACLRAFEARETNAEAPTSPDRLRETLCAFRIREYAWAAAQIVAGNDRDEIKQQAETMAQAVAASA